MTAGSAAESAAGLLLWRPDRDGADGPQVLLVHRARYDDWSWPKGGPQPRERAPETALRETLEETGRRALPGRPLDAVEYRLPDGRPKRVEYWAARVRGGRGQGDAQGSRPSADGEVDRTAWVPAGRARELLTRAGDAAPLDRLVQFHTEGVLETFPLLVVRHATARPRDAWSHRDAERPLVAAGRRQSLALAALLACWRPERLLTSPSVRCTETVRPYLAASGARLRAKRGLGEEGHRRDPRTAARHVAALLRPGRPALLCTHRPVLVTVMAALADAAADAGVRVLLEKGVPLARAELLVAHVTATGGRTVVAVERHASPR